MKWNQVRWLLAIALLVSSSLTASLVSAQEATPSAGYSQDTLDAVQLILADVDAGLMPGVVMFIDSPNGQILEANGVANTETGAPIDPNAQFQIGSNTKMMTGAIVLQLQEEGLLNVDDLLSVHLPEVAAAFPSGDQFTIRMLLNHTSGLYDVVDDMAAGIFTSWELAGSTAALEQQWTHEQAVAYAAKYKAGDAYFLPGTEGEWHYTNTGYFILGMLIEKLTGKSVAENFQARIFDPLGMSNTSYSDGVWQSDIRGYFMDIDTTSWNLSQGGAAGAVVSTPQDMAIFMRALLGGKLFTNPETLGLMQTTVDAQPLLAQYGLGLIDFGNGVWGHGGQTLGFNSKVFYVPASDTVVVAWTNTATPASQAFILMQFSVAGWV